MEEFGQMLPVTIVDKSLKGPWKDSIFPVYFDQRKLGSGKIDKEELAKQDFCLENTKAKTRKNFTSNEDRESRRSASHYRPRE